MHRFDSGRRLQLALVVAFAASACKDPTGHPPRPLEGFPRWSTAPHVHWSSPDTSSPFPMAVMVDVPGGPLDRIASDDDVATFLNDRFQPVFLVPDASPLPSGATFLDREGCVLAGPVQPNDAAGLIAIMNELQIERSRGARGRRIEALQPPSALPLSLDSPLRLACSP